MTLNQLNPKPFIIPLDPEEHDFEYFFGVFLSVARRFVPKFEVTSDNVDVYRNCVKYFIGDPSCSYSLEKGLYLYGPVGTCKTVLLKIARQFNLEIISRNYFDIKNITDIVDETAVTGFKYFNSFDEIPMGRFIERQSLCRDGFKIQMALDDVGQSSDVVIHFGDKIPIIRELIKRRYYAFSDEHVLTHITTNMLPDKIEEVYGAYVSSRMREMFTPVLLNGPDRRK